MSTLKQKLKKVLGWSAIIALMSGLILPALISSQQAQALDLEFDVFDEEEWCQGQEDSDSWIQCSDEEGTSFVDFDGEFAPPDAEGYAEGITQTSSAREFIVNVTNFVLSFLGLAAVVVIIYGGFLYVTAGGEQEKADKGKKSVMYAVMGIIIVLISYALVNTIIMGAAGGEDESSSGGLYSSSGVSSEALVAYQSETMAKELQDIGEEYMAAYSAYVNVAAILDAMANLGYFGDAGLEDYEEGFDLIQNQVESLSATNDIVQEALVFLNRYISSTSWTDQIWQFFSGEENKLNANLFEAWVPLANAEDEEEVDEVTVGEESTDAEDEENACIADCQSTYDMFDLQAAVDYVSCHSSCTSEADATRTMDPYEIGVDMVAYVEAISQQAYTDFQTTIGTDLKTRLEDLSTSFEGLALADDFNTLIAAFESYATTSAQSGTEYTYTYLAGSDSVSTTIYLSPNGGSSAVADNLDVLNTLYALVKELEFTTAIISANTDEGNAPVTVTFSGLDSYDPTEATIGDAQYTWDLLGNGFETYTEEENAETDIGPSLSYTYTEPGTYRVALRVDSSEPTKIASGISYMSIKVNPPASIINLTGQCSLDNAGCDEQDVTEYTDWTITREMASSGVTFDASMTTDGSGNYDTIVNFEFDYGDGETDSGESNTVTHYYTEEGEYDFELEVTDQNGIKDRKRMKLIVSSPAALVEVDDQLSDNGGSDVGEIGDTITFTAEGSQTDNGTIDTYDWSISKDGGEELTDGTINSNEPHLYEYTFDEAGLYTISVLITDSGGYEDDDSMEFTVNSGEPEAAFDYETPDSTHPNRVHFDGSKSIDTDTGDNDTLTYEWSIDGTEGTDYEFVEGTDASWEAPIVDFATVDDYEVTLTVYNDQVGDLQMSNSYTRKVSVDSVLSIDAELSGGAAVFLGEDGTAEVTLDLASNYGVSYAVDWADDSAENFDSTTTSISHKYEAAGIYPVSVTVYDADNKTNSVVRNVYIGNGEAPIPVIRVYVDNIESADANNVIGNRTNTFRFDGGDSLDLDGSVINNSTSFSWDFGDGSNPARGERLTHEYTEIGEFEVTLTVQSPSDSELVASSTILVNIEDAAPEIYSVSVTPDSDELVTPLSVTIKVNADDMDGTIESYKFWYYDVDNSSEELDVQISAEKETKLTINTNGTTGESKTYGFIVEITDNENNTVSSVDELPESGQPSLEVENGTNISPVADFTVNKTSIMKDETVTFVSSSYDEDGSIVSYTWDVDGDGFYNDSNPKCENDPNSDHIYSSCTFTYDYVAKDGVEVRVRVEDDMGSTDTSDPIVIYVDSLTEDPEAAFDWGVNLNGDNPLEVWFDNMSSADINNGAELASYEWDFDLATSSNDGDDDPDNDIDSIDANGLDENGNRHVYDDFGDYQVRLTVYDTEGNSSSIDRWIKVIEVDPPKAIFAYELDEDNWLKVQFQNNSKVGEGSEIESYAWDFDLEVNSDGVDGTDDDIDSTDKSPSFAYDDESIQKYKDAIEEGKLKVEVQLTVTDNLGRFDSTTETITLEEPTLELDELEAFFSAYGQSEEDGIVYLEGEEADVIFVFTANGVYGEPSFCIDQDNDYDTNGNNDTQDDCDPVDAVGGGTYYNGPQEAYYHFKKAWANSANQIKVTLTVKDTATSEVDGEEGRKDTAYIILEFVEEEVPVAGSTSMLPVTSVEALYILAIALAFTLIGAKIYIKQGEDLPSDY